MYPDSIQRLITELSRLPGVGGRTATRLAFHILRAPPEQAAALASAIVEVRELIGECEVCFDLAEGPRCPICLDQRRDEGVICVVEQSQDVYPIERTRRIPRPLPRTRRRPLADGWGRRGGPPYR